MLLQPQAFCPLPLASIAPGRWLRRQLGIQADGLSGHLGDFWPDVKDSRWFGGRAEGWERAPYWLDGAIPLAFLLQNEPLKAQVVGYMDYILRHQAEDGWLGPGGRTPEDRKRTDLWSLILNGSSMTATPCPCRQARRPAMNRSRRSPSFRTGARTCASQSFQR